MYTMAEQVWASSAKIWNFHKVEFEQMCWRYRPKADKDECSIFVEEVQNLKKYGGLIICGWSLKWRNKYEDEFMVWVHMKYIICWSPFWRACRSTSARVPTANAQCTWTWRKQDLQRWIWMPDSDISEKVSPKFSQPNATVWQQSHKTTVSLLLRST